MLDIRIKTVDYSDIARWVSLSKEYDGYIKEIVSDLTEWYEGDGSSSVSFDDYMGSKISKGEAFMAIGADDDCRGIIAVSIANNRITFFGVSHKYDFYEVGDFLLAYALSKLNINANITTNIVKSNAEPFQKERSLFNKYDFTYSHDGLENGVPVCCMERRNY